MARLLGAMAAEHSPSPGEGSQIPNPQKEMGNRTEIPAPTSAKYPSRPGDTGSTPHLSITWDWARRTGREGC